MDKRAIITAILAYGKAELALGAGTGAYTDVDAALDLLLIKLWPVPGKEMARHCAWGGHYFTEADEALARTGCWISHGVCPEHAHLLDEQAGAMDRQVVR